MVFDIPILFLGYNRPNLTKITLERIMQINPLNLYVSLDGPNSDKEGDWENCLLVKQLVYDTVRKDCNLHFRINSANEGCKVGVKNGIDWFFGLVEYGIILEDDCLPNLSFFNFCKVLLEKYKFDFRISLISGSNFQYGIWRGLGSYYFSKYTHIWGWATWKRAWNDYDISMSQFKTNKRILKNIDALPFKLMNDVYLDKVDTWDIQWFYSNFIHKRLSIIPNVNLIQNIGFHDDATHTKGKIYSYISSSMSGDLLFPLKFNNCIRPNKLADDLVSLMVFGNRKYDKVSEKKYKIIFLFSKALSFFKILYFDNRLFKKKLGNFNG